MKYFQRFISAVLLFTSVVLFAQNTQNNEKEILEFQEHFFEALKQKAIQNYDKALESLHKCYEIDAVNTALLFEFSKNYLLQKKYNEAEYFINKALTNEPNNYFLKAHKATLFKNQKAYKKAAEVLETMIDKHPKHTDELVWLYIKQKNHKRAKEIIKKAEKRAYTSVRLRRYKTAVNQKKRISVKATPKKEEVEESISFLREQFTSEKDYKTLQKLLKKEDVEKKYQLMYEDSKKGLSFFPMQSYLYAMNGKALNELQRFKEAVTILQEGVDYVIDDVKLQAFFYKQIAIAYNGLKKPKKAEEFLRKAKKLKL